jgi:2-polyprenyl-3-methyl-5-hydroxy-6-metoxy-1,4-benzoquinol methylase
MKALQGLFALARRLWIRWVGAKTRYTSDYRKFELMYWVSNPWKMDSEGETFRFRETNRIASKTFGKVGTLLEIGCGEGHQTRYFEQICSGVTGIDVSPRAIKRARKICPNSDFIAGDVFCQAVAQKAPYDLVVCCEVLYYMSDVQATIRRIMELGRNALITYFDGEMEHLDPLVLSIPGCESEIIKSDGSSWRIACIRANSAL